jgi:hypothetical protein
MITSKRNILIVVSIVIGIAAWLGTMPRYYVENHPGVGQLLWNQNEMFLIIGTAERGYSTSPIRMVKESIYAFAGTVSGPPADLKTAVLVLHYGAAKLDKHVLPNASFGIYTAFEDHLYGPGGRWDGAQFATADAAEVRSAFDSAGPGHAGWNQKLALLTTGAPETIVPMHLGMEDVRLIVRVPSAQVKSVLLQRGSNAPEEVWVVDGRVRRVQKSEYDSEFGR